MLLFSPSFFMCESSIACSLFLLRVCVRERPRESENVTACDPGSARETCVTLAVFSAGVPWRGAERSGSTRLLSSQGGVPFILPPGPVPISTEPKSCFHILGRSPSVEQDAHARQKRTACWISADPGLGYAGGKGMDYKRRSHECLRVACYITFFLVVCVCKIGLHDMRKTCDE